MLHSLMVCLILADRQNYPGTMKDESVAAAVPASPQEDHKNSAALVLILDFAPLSALVVKK